VGRRLLSRGNSWRQEARTAAFQSLDQPVDAELRVNFAEQVNVIGHNLKFDDFGLKLLRRLE